MYSNFVSGLDTNISTNTIINSAIGNFVDLRAANLSNFIKTTLINELFDPYLEGDYDLVEENFKRYYDDVILLLYKNRDVPLVKELMKGVSVLQRSMFLITELQNKDRQINQLKQALADKLEAKKGASANIQTTATADAVLDFRYILYIREFGPPVNGIFDPIKLASLG